MTPTTITFGVTDLALEKVHDVARTKLPVPNAVFSFVVKALGSFVAGALEKARHLAELVVWFQGAIVALQHEKMDAHVDRDDRIVLALEDVEVTLLDMRHEVLMLSSQMADAGHLETKVAKALRAVSHACTDLHEAMIAFKWSVMEHDADVDVARGDVQVFEDAGSLLASLRI